MKYGIAGSTMHNVRINSLRLWTPEKIAIFVCKVSSPIFLSI